MRIRSLKTLALLSSKKLRRVADIMQQTSFVFSVETRCKKYHGGWQVIVQILELGRLEANPWWVMSCIQALSIYRSASVLFVPAGAL